MKRFKNILAVIDPLSNHDEALERAALLATENDARLSAIACFDDALPSGGAGDAIRQRIVAGLTDRLAEIAEPIRARGIELDIRLVFGEPFLETIRRVLRARHDLVVKVANRHDLEATLHFGSTDLRLMRKSPCPVWIINPEPEGEAAPSPAGARRGVLACVDPISDNDQNNQVAATIMELATSLAALESSPCHAVHAWTAPIEYMWADSPWIQVDPKDVDELTILTEERHAARFHELVERFRPTLSDFSAHLRKGDAATVISEIAAELNVELIIMSTIGRTGISGLFIGNTAETVLSRVTCSVMAIKPRGFVSPVSID